jgi:uncharacterized protein (TIGR00730 family)
VIRQSAVANRQSKNTSETRLPTADCRLPFYISAMPDAPKKPNAAQLASPSYRLAALDQDFLLGEDMRGIRFALEYSKAELLLKKHEVLSTIVVFGSARIREDGPGKQAYWYNEARTFGRIASERGGAVHAPGLPCQNVIATGGGPGAMEAANRGALEAGAKSIGFNITLPLEQEPNPYTSPELTFNFHYFAMRKMHLAMRANALVVFPGGFGTLDELFEILTLRQTGKVGVLPVVLFDEAYWREIVNFDALLKHGAIAAEDLQLFRFAESAEDAWTALVEQGLGAAHPGGALEEAAKEV